MSNVRLKHLWSQCIQTPMTVQFSALPPSPYKKQKKKERERKEKGKDATERNKMRS